ncbi:MAG: hypothetical protein M1826_004772 [Phylliscum demangeonii]|nr:MAG: hypothetical protein M1826_004772 [Phylliscum demangeonii]
MHSKEAQLEKLERRLAVNAPPRPAPHQKRIFELDVELAGAREELERYEYLLQNHKHTIDRAYELGKLLDQVHVNIPVQQHVADRMVPWLPPRDLPDKVLECAYSYLSIPEWHDLRLVFKTVTASDWEEALDECSRWHGYTAPKDWALWGTGEVQITRSVNRHTRWAVQDGQGDQVRAAADARKKAGGLGLNFQQHPESSVKKQAAFHVGIPAWATHEFKRLGKEAKAAGALRWSRVAEEGKMLEVSAIRSGV